MKVGICAIIKDCYKPYLLEWFNHHHFIGVDHFFIYDNESKPSISEIVKDIGFDVHVEMITGTVKQFAAYHKCLADIKSGALPRCDRVAFIDEDEFIVCENNDIKETLKEYEEFSGIGISWQMFGSSGIKEKTPEGQRIKFTQHTSPDFPANRHIKSIVNPFLAERLAGNPHCFIYSTGNCVNVNKEIVQNAFTDPIYKKIWLDHYFTRSLEEWNEKVERGRADVDEPRSLSEFYEIDFNCSGREPKRIHLVIPFYRYENKQKLIDAYRPMNVILHPITFQDEVTDFNEPWIEPFIIPMNSSECEVEVIECFKRNKFILGHDFNDDDYYVTVDDDDMYEPGVFDDVRLMDDDIVIISMKRGYQIPDVSPEKRYSVATLFAHPERVRITMISGQQSFVKGKIFKNHLHLDEFPCWDGELAMHYKETGEQIAYRPDLFAMFNFYEPTRWEKRTGGISFGVMVNDVLRLNMCFQQSQFPKGTSCHTLKNPESATKGLNLLLGLMETEGADVAVLTHQDMFYRREWIPRVKEQIALLPESWVIAGIIGKDMKGLVCGQYHDMRVPQDFNTKHIHEFPQPACCLDECCIIVNLKKGFRFDETMDGFDLYGTLCVLQAAEQGGTAWIIDAFAEHFIMRPFSWCPDDNFCRNYKWLFDRFTAQRVDSTALGLPEGQVTRELIFETSAA